MNISLLGIHAVLVVACTSSSDPTQPFLGTWNYDQPSRSSGRNIGVVTCPAPGPSLVVPQIGWIELSRAGETAIRGTTDQGCSWDFTVDGDTATLDPPRQTCFNRVIGSSYTLEWSIAVSEDRETETITGTSHLPTGDCVFALPDGVRTKVRSQPTVDPTSTFVGTWSYDAPDFGTGTNIEQRACDGPPSYAPRVGGMTITKRAEGSIQAITDLGCVWTFAVRGNTAELEPASQSCTTSDGVTSMASFWALASDGPHAAEFSSGWREDVAGSCNVLVTAGALTKR